MTRPMSGCTVSSSNSTDYTMRGIDIHGHRHCLSHCSTSTNPDVPLSYHWLVLLSQLDRYSLPSQLLQHWRCLWLRLVHSRLVLSWVELAAVLYCHTSTPGYEDFDFELLSSASVSVCWFKLLMWLYLIWICRQPSVLFQLVIGIM